MSGLPEMPCVEFVERVNDYLEGALIGDDRARLEQHLEACSHCAHYLDQLQLIRVKAGAVTDADIAPQMRRDLLGAFSKWQAER